MAPFLPTPSQTAGPFVSIGTEWDATGRMVEEGSPAVITVMGTVFDGRGEPVTDAMLEFWQADPEGHFPPETASTWTGFTRCLTYKGGRFRLVTVKPGSVPGPDGEAQAPHIDVSLFARGLLQRLVTRIYFWDEEARKRCPTRCWWAWEAWCLYAGCSLRGNLVGLLLPL